MADNPQIPPVGVPPQYQHMFQGAEPQEAPQPYKRVGMNQYGPSVKSIARGSLVWFKYLNYQHDPAPLVVVTDIWPNHIRGVNLHYLTFNYIKRLLTLHMQGQGHLFSYFHVRQDQYLVNSFRTYKRMGVKQIKSLDTDFLLNVLGNVMSFDPAEVEQMRVYVREQMGRDPNQKAESTTEKYMGMQRGNAEHGFEQPHPPQEPRGI